MNVDFTPEQQPFVQHAIESGRILRPEDAVKEALSLWVERERQRSENHPATLTKTQAAAKIRELRKGNFLPPGVTIGELISEGRA
jgi:Arc/MetJ-type ribon-helix-helix transcriptional regulator